MAYVLKEGEAEAPAGLRAAFAKGNRLQDILLGEMKTGLTGNQIRSAGGRPSGRGQAREDPRGPGPQKSGRRPGRLSAGRRRSEPVRCPLLRVLRAKREVDPIALLEPLPNLFCARGVAYLRPVGQQ